MRTNEFDSVIIYDSLSFFVLGGIKEGEIEFEADEDLGILFKYECISDLVNFYIPDKLKKNIGYKLVDSKKTGTLYSSEDTFLDGLLFKNESY